MLELLLAQERTCEQDSEKPPRTTNKWDPVKFFKSFHNKGHHRGRDQPSTGQRDWERDAEEESKTAQVSFLRGKSFFFFLFFRSLFYSTLFRFCPFTLVFPFLLSPDTSSHDFPYVFLFSLIFSLAAKNPNRIFQTL